ncbi:hypothetical protein F4860DRAFT_520091 [Xylaria cubensis]|nr:hypothetical protein F4860DRAFT_520091 [Xylaria cubensis]
MAFSRTLEEQLKATSGFSDLTIVCQGVEFATHRFIVCANSRVLTAALAGNFSEAKSRVLNMDFDLDSVKRFLEFLYTGDYHEIPEPALALIASVPAHDKRLRDATVQQNTEQAIFFYGGADDQNAGAEDSALANLQLSNLTIDAINRVAESWICHCRMSSVADYYNVAQLSAISLAKLEEGLRNEWCIESFCALLLECLDEVSNRDTLCLLGNIAAENYDEPTIFQLFEAGGPCERLAPFVLTSCIKKLKETQALREEAEICCEQVKRILNGKESELTQSQWASAPECSCHPHVIHDIARFFSPTGYAHTSLASTEPPPVYSELPGTQSTHAAPQFELASESQITSLGALAVPRELKQQTKAQD